jgi:hypothetical protein
VRALAERFTIKNSDNKNGLVMIFLSIIGFAFLKDYKLLMGL